MISRARKYSRSIGEPGHEEGCHQEGKDTQQEHGGGKHEQNLVIFGIQPKERKK